MSFCSKRTVWMLLAWLSLIHFSWAAWGTPPVASVEEKTSDRESSSGPAAQKQSCLHMQLGGKTFTLEVATTPEEHTRGLMYREQLAPDHGMLFNFPVLQSVSFWMKNCKIPLDMVFLRQDRIVHIVHSAPPCTQDPCPTYPSHYFIDRVIELPGGTANHLSLHPGDRVNLIPPSP